MRILNHKTQIDFMRFARIAVTVSAVVVLVGIVSLATLRLNLGLDFTGGTLIEVGYENAPETAQVRDELAAAGLNAQVQVFGAATDILVRIPPVDDEETSADLSTRVLETLKASADGGVEMRRVEFVGPQVGEELTEQGILAVLYALIGIFLYVMFRFQWRFSVGAVTAVVHDIVVTMGFLSLARVEFDLTVVAALLAVVGYSLNDTIVLFDRIRENFPRLRKKSSREVVNTSVNQTLARTLMTSLTTLLVLIALAAFGGEIIHAFALTLIVGVIVGTYSSIYVASTSLLALGVSKYDLMPVEKEGAEVDALP